jgi:pimeloyl-ACP methyl ester carboxylesterase
MTVFGLIHGSWQAGWVWGPLTEELERLGHRAIAADMPCEDPDAGAADYAAVMVDALRDVKEDVVLLGHSLGGLSIPVVAAMRPVKTLVFMASGIPQIGTSYAAQLKEANLRQKAAFDQVTLDEHGCTILPREVAIDVLYNECEPSVARWAADQLRYQAQKPITEVTPLTEWPSAESVYIACRGDRILHADWQCRLSRERLGKEPIELSGDHTPMLSAPKVLASVLDEIQR